MIEHLYKKLSKRSAPALRLYLKHRIKTGKEDASRIEERYGVTATPRPSGKLIWIHAASVGESQAALILIEALSKTLPNAPLAPYSFLVTTGTRTSAYLMNERLPENAIHQYAPLDNPDWVRQFFDHWTPDIALWMESELWPNTLKFLKKRDIPAALINARISEKSFKTWGRSKDMAGSILSCFDTILCQTETHKHYFDSLGAQHTLVTDNLKYSATPLPYKESDLKALKAATKNRPLWLYASTHAGEEELACETHTQLKKTHPNLLTIIVPRHPERRDSILKDCAANNSLSFELRSEKDKPSQETDIYIADTLGELGLFYSLSDISIIGRSFSNDGGGGHNPIEAALLKSAVLTGPNYQNQQDLFDTMISEDAALLVTEKKDLASQIDALLNNETERNALIQAGQDYASRKANVIGYVMDEIEPLFLKVDMPYTLSS